MTTLAPKTLREVDASTFHPGRGYMLAEKVAPSETIMVPRANFNGDPTAPPAPQDPDLYRILAIGPPQIMSTGHVLEPVCEVGDLVIPTQVNTPDCWHEKGLAVLTQGGVIGVVKPCSQP